jgi:RNase H-fold protein (predicted Holliday junction resolvase)
MSVTTVLAIDPGRAKCGLAVVSGIPGEHSQVLHRSTAERSGLSETVRSLAAIHAPDIVLLGNGTGHQQALEDIRQTIHAPVQVVDEHGTTLIARKLYFRENPPRGWRRLIPVSMQTPPEPYDGYVAQLLAQRHLEKL